jgi:hypothetical protein
MANEGWRPGPAPGFERYWDGKRWTMTRPQQESTGEAMTDKFVVGMQPTSQVTLWEGQKKSLTNAATKGAVVGASYRVTEDALYFQTGVVSTHAELIPLWAVLDIDIHQGITQKARGIGDLWINLDVDHFRYGQRRVMIESVEQPMVVREIISGAANTQRRIMLDYLHGMEVEKRKAGASAFHVPGSPAVEAAPAMPAQDQILEQLKQLAELKTSGILTDDEFAVQKARILAGG